MKIFISADLEGVNGVVAPEDVEEAGSGYQQARVFMTEEVNAVVEGAFAGGAAEILVCDSHNVSQNIRMDLLDSRVRLMRGVSRRNSMVHGLDETFDGLDPVMRQAVKSLFANDMAERNLTPIIASHNLRELEDICDHVGILHKGGILLSKDLDDMKLNLHKIQCVLRPGMEAGEIPGLEILKTERRGSLSTITVRGTREEVEAAMRSCEPVFFEAIPLSLEEIFISETEVAGYDVKKLIF